MRLLKSYKQFLESLTIDVGYFNIDLNESLSTFYENILKSIGAEEVDIFDTLKMDKSKLPSTNEVDLETLSDIPEFIDSLAGVGLKKSTLQNSKDLETFLNKPCRFMLVYEINANELENPVYIFFQSWNESLNKWDGTKLYKVNGDIKNFYDKLSSKVIEIDDSGEKYIYNTSNGNEWELQNIDKENDVYQKYFRTADFEKLINDRKVVINII